MLLFNITPHLPGQHPPLAEKPPPLKVSIVALMALHWPGRGTREESFCLPLCCQKNPLPSTCCAAPDPPTKICWSTDTLRAAEHDVLQRDSRAGTSHTTFGERRGLRWERRRQQHDGRNSNDIGTHFKHSFGSTLPERNLGPGFGFFLLCFLQNRKAYCGCTIGKAPEGNGWIIYL